MTDYSKQLAEELGCSDEASLMMCVRAYPSIVVAKAVSLLKENAQLRAEVKELRDEAKDIQRHRGDMTFEEACGNDAD